MAGSNIHTENYEEEINVEEIMGKIREKIRKRKETGIYPEKDIIELLPGPLPEKPSSDSNIQKDLRYINSNWDIKNNSYFISSHRPIVGKFLVTGRDLVHGEVKRYMDPIVWKQAEFNGSVTRLFNDAGDKLAYCNNKIEQLQSEIESKIGQLRPELENKVDNLRPEFENEINYLKFELVSKIEQFESEIDNTIKKVETNSVASFINLEIENKAWLARILDNRIEEGNRNEKIETADPNDLDINYYRFEEQFRGSREDIKERQSNFISYFTECTTVLDIGCGRGEFLELLKKYNIGAKGIDVDDTMVDYCLSKGLNVVKDDAISYLEKLDDKSLDGIFIDQVVEHLEPAYLINLLKLCFQKLKYGYYIFVETVNPLTLVSFANFYIDMTHKKPVHPETLKFLLTSAGFRDLDTKFLSPVSEEAKLEKVPMNDNLESWAKNYFDAYNHNIDKLNLILFGAQDYAVIGKK